MTKIAYSTMIGLFIGFSLFWRPAVAQDLDTVDNFVLVKGEKEVALADFRDQKVVVVVFTSSHCSWATQYVDRLHDMHKAFVDSSVAFIAINSNDPTLSQRDAEARMAKFAPFPFPYLKDKDQEVAKMFKITKNPEVVVLTPLTKGFDVIYRGKIDDNPLDASMVKQSFLTEAIRMGLKGEAPEESSTTPNGCSIKWMD